ncbi:MAG: hypothetical protein ABH824_01520 [Nanoarchaeota archaeon]
MNDVLNSYNSISRLKEGELEAFPFMLKLMTWDKWCSIYVSSEIGLSNKRKSRIKHNHYKRCYLNIKDDSVL